MKKNNLLFLLSLFAIWACTPKADLSLDLEPYESRRPRTVDRHEAVFLEAEKMYEEKAFLKALDAYRRYLNDNPLSPTAPVSLLKIGLILTERKQYEQSRQAFQNLIIRYPGSPFVSDAEYGLLVTWYKQKEYQKAVKQASDLLQTTHSKHQRIRIYGLLGETFMMMRSFKDAFYAFAETLRLSEEKEKSPFMIKMKESLFHLGTDDILYLLKRFEDSISGSYLIHQLGLAHLKEKHYRDGVTVLSEFIERFPDHEYTPSAREVIDEIYKTYLCDLNTIGCLLPLSGPYKSYGDKALRGIELALHRYHSIYPDKNVKMIIKDTGSDKSKTIRAIDELEKSRVGAIIGPMTNAEIAAHEVQAKKIPIITLTQKDHIPEIGDYVFRNFLTPKMQVETLVSYVTDQLGLKRFAVLYPQEHYGTTFMNLFWDQVTAHGGRMVGVESYAIESTDFAEPIKKLVGLHYEMSEDLKEAVRMLTIRKYDEIMPLSFPSDQAADHEDDEGGFADEDDSADDADSTTHHDDRSEQEDEEEPEPIVDFDALFIPDAPGKVGLIVPQLAFYDVKGIYLLGTNLWHSERLIDMSRKYIQGAIMVDGFFTGSSSAHVKHFVETFQKHYAQPPGFIEAVCYDNSMILLNILGESDICLRNTIKDRLTALTSYKGITGLTTFDEKGDALKTLRLLQVKGKKFIELTDGATVDHIDRRAVSMP